MDQPPSRAFRMPPFVLFVICGLIAVFYLPYHVPVAPSGSDSYLFGYSNRTGILLFLLLAVACALWSLRLNIPFSTDRQVAKVPLPYLWVTLILQFAACTGMYLWIGRFGGFAESNLEIIRVWQMTLGKRPYINFVWTHGYIDLYGPLWTSRLLHLGIVNGYFVFWAIYSLVGTYLVFININLVDYPCSYKRHFFAFQAVGLILSAECMGTHYTAVRYAAPLLFVLIIYRLKERKNTGWAAILSVIFTAILLAISPEIAISHAFACLILLFPWKLMRASISDFVRYFAVLLSVCLLFWIALKLHTLDYMLSAASGDASFPIIPAPHILFFFAVVFLCFAYLARRVRQNQFRDNTIALILFSIPMAFAALERCDPGHISGNGAGFFIAAFFYVASHPRMRQWYFAGFIISFYSFSLVTGNILLLWPLFSSIPRDVPKVVDLNAIYHTANFSKVEPVFQAPFGYRPNRFRPYLSPQIEYGFYDGLNAVYSPMAIQTKIEELAHQPAHPLLLEKEFSVSCERDPHTERFLISFIFAFPYTARGVHTDSISKPLCDYIRSHYLLAEPATRENYEYGLWLPKSFVTNRAGSLAVDSTEPSGVSPSAEQGR